MSKGGAGERVKWTEEADALIDLMWPQACHVIARAITAELGIHCTEGAVRYRATQKLGLQIEQTGNKVGGKRCTSAQGRIMAERYKATRKALGRGSAAELYHGPRDRRGAIDGDFDTNVEPLADLIRRR